MSKSKLEYLWLDGYEPTANVRSKTRIEEDFSGKLEDCPMWSFDGSSTKQAEGGSSDCLLKPVAIYPDPARRDGYLVMTEVLNADGTPHVSNSRATIDDADRDFWFGFEQEYFIMDTATQLPLGFPVGGYPGPQGLYYCSVGGRNTWEETLLRSMQIFVWTPDLPSKVLTKRLPLDNGSSIVCQRCQKAGDEIWVARYLLQRLTESYGYYIEFHPKPVKAIGTVLGCTPTSPTLY